MGNRIPHRGEPDTAPWGTGYRTVGNRIIFFIYKNQIFSAYFCAVKGFKSYLKERSAPKTGLWITFPFGSPQTPLKKEFASLTSFLIGRGAVAPSQTLPSRNRAGRDHENEQQEHHRKTQKTASRGRHAAGSGPKQLRRGYRKARKQRKQVFCLPP